MTTANKITMVRIAIIPLFVAVMLIEIPYSSILALFLFAAAGITDRIDGYVARKYNQITNIGKFLDPLADKLLVMSAIIILVEWGRIPSWAAIIIIAREFAVTGLRLIAIGDGIIVAAGISGKIKTVVSIVAICLMLTEFQEFGIMIEHMAVDGIAVACILATTVWSGVEYFYKNRKLLRFRAK